ncbi:hypothetical protein O1L44_09135 [Streptomyces noursei]|nr:hypothetical protein [Streptomyces noursei]
MPRPRTASRPGRPPDPATPGSSRSRTPTPGTSRPPGSSPAGRRHRTVRDHRTVPRPDADTEPFETTGQFPRPATGRAEPAGQVRQPDAGRAPAGQDPLGDPLSGPLRGDPLGTTDARPVDDRTPIFDTIESNWFNTPAAAAAGVPPLPRRDGGQDGAAPGDTPAGGVPAAGAPAGGAAREAPRPTPAHSGGPRRTTRRGGRRSRSASRPRAGHHVRAARRVPRANLVAGTAQQQAPQGGPQVSRAPSDVRGRLTNLRRGIQQGRQAGTSSTGNHGIVDPSHQQER